MYSSPGKRRNGNAEYWEEPFRQDKSNTDKVERTYLHNLPQFRVFHRGLFQVVGNVAMSGTMIPVGPGAPGTLTIFGNYEQTGNGILRAGRRDPIKLG